MALKAALRFDAGAELGMGHAHRCLALADALAKRSCDITLLTRTPETLEPLRPAFPVQVLGESDLDTDASPAARADLLVLDYLDAPWVRIETIRNALPNTKLVLLGNREHETLADIVIRQDLERPSPDPTVINGGGHLLLKDQFTALPSRVETDRARKALVCLGGGHARGLENLLTFIDIYAPADLSHVHVIGSDGHKASPRNPKHQFTFEDRTDQMAARMVDADIGFLAGGGLIFEAAAAGLPCVYCPVVPHQDAQVAAVMRAGLGFMGGRPGQLDAAHFREALAKLTDDRAKRHSCSQVGQRLVDGQGARRVAKVLIALCSPDED